jgi:hypothetical protein
MAGLVVHVSNPSIGDMEVGGLRVGNQPRIRSEFKASLSYIVRPCLKPGAGNVAQW